MTTHQPKTFDESFASSLRAQYWHPTKNGNLQPRDITLKSGRKIWFLCPECNHDFDIIPKDITIRNRWCRFCANQQLCDNDSCELCYSKSFASSDKSQYWIYEMNNNIKPRDVFKSTGSSFWFKCIDCSHSFNAILNDISSGRWCPFCAKKRLCDEEHCPHCLEQSFASHPQSKYWHPNKNELTPRHIFKNSNNKFFFKCDICKHDFDARIKNISYHDTWCPYCTVTKMCNDTSCIHCHNKSFASSPFAKYWHMTKNTCTPRDVFLNCNDKFWFTCRNNHEFNTSLNKISSLGRWCPLCVNKTEALLLTYLQQQYPDVEYQKSFDWCKSASGRLCKFDFYLPRQNIIIELDGRQHFQQVSNWDSPEIIQANDQFKMDECKKHNIRVIRLLQEDVWNDRNDWKQYLHDCINLDN